MQPINFSDLKWEIPELMGENYKVWNERILLHLGWMDIDYAIRKEEPPLATKTILSDGVDRYEMWERSNSLNAMFIKTNISTIIYSCVD